MNENIKTEYISSKPNIIALLLEQCPDKPWDICALLKNPNTPIEYINRHFERHIEDDCFCNSTNPRLTMEIVKKYPSHLFNFFQVAQNKNITLKDIEENLNLPWDWNGISLNPNLTIDFIKKYKDRDWSWYYISTNNVFTPKDVNDNPDIRWDYRGLSYNSSITQDFVFQNKDKDWDMICLSANSVISSRFIEEHKSDFKWCMSSVSINPNVDMDFIERHINWKWDYNNISRKKNLTIQFLRKYKDRKWDWYLVSSNCVITQKDMDNNPDLPWNPFGHALNPNIDLERKQYMNYSAVYLVRNPSITLDFIEHILDFIEFGELSGNRFLYDEYVYRREICKDIEERRDTIFDIMKRVSQLPRDLNRILENYISFN
jgi:hypothetical protein